MTRASASFSLEDKYRVQEGVIAITGVQALVRVPIDQNRRDRASGLHTATFISGYQGSPLGELDKQIKMAGPVIPEHDIVWRSGINEDVAATAIYGSQLAHSFPQPRYDGVLGMWYGKAPGVDRTLDAFKHGQFIGIGKYGGALALAGDDHACKSSTLPCASDIALYDCNMPILYPGDPKEVLEFGLHGFAMSRFSGLWVAIKMITNVADGGAIIEVWPGLGEAKLPFVEIDGKPFQNVQDPRLLPPYSVETERRIHYERKIAALAYARENRLNRITVQSSTDRIGFVSAGKSYYDLLQAFEMLGLGEEQLRQAGIRLLKMGMIAPVEPRILREFAQGLEEIVVVEEKRGLMELLIRDDLYNVPGHPAVYGKRDRRGRPQFQIHSELQVDGIARGVAEYLAEKLGRVDLPERLRWLAELGRGGDEPVMARTPYFCSGCPHNTSTTLPEGEIAGGGIGCHAMAISMNRGVMYLTQMGGEGAPWMGIAPFSNKEHFFQNVGDGTFFHSASKSFEASVAAGVNMTYKILVNSASAMTGGQSVVGALPPVRLAEKLVAEGASEVVIVPEDLTRYPRKRYGEKIRVRPKADYNQVMLDLREVKGVTAIIFDQQCAAEKRRMRKRGLLPTPNKRVFIHEGVCEGCGDCGVKSNCMSVIPVETEYGRKTRIHQSSCNMDYSCLKGDCPSFMTVELAEGTKPVRKKGLASPLEAILPEPEWKASSYRPYTVLLVGIGGTGVVTVDQLLVTAALQDGKFALHLDQTGLAQKGGPVLSNFIVCDRPMARANKIAAGETDALIAFDLLTAVAKDNLTRYNPERTRAVINTTANATAQMVTDVHSRYPARGFLSARIAKFLRPDGVTLAESERINDGLFGNNLAANVFLIGVAYQAGLLPLSAESLEGAIRANAVAVEQNLQAFRWGRQYKLDPARVEDLIAGGEPKTPDPRAAALEKLARLAPRQVPAFEGLLARLPDGNGVRTLLYPRVSDLILYQGPRWAARYLDLVLKTVKTEHERTPGRTELAEAVARWGFKLMAYKDEYEVARLWTQGPDWDAVKRGYEGRLKRYYHLHPPLLRAIGLKRKLRLGEWFTPAMRLLARLRFLRGTPLDVFGYAPIRREERRLIGWYRDLIGELLPALNHENHAVAVQIASLPDNIRGYESVKQRFIAETMAQLEPLREAFRQPKAERKAV
jgi:indolepyruvate ferredoxin oxidoreductase